ncbi:MAG TPA: CAP domain-containing protein [Mobilitalea sp.]|nr:CAP domain-containing protein [Mobilitalea sp.]
MKKYIATSVCTLFLSLLGAWGFNPNSINALNPANSNLNTTNVEQSVTKTEDQNLSTNTNTTTTDNSSSGQVVKEEASASTGNEDKNTAVEAASTSASNCNKGKVLVYKNVNLSNCKSTKDVVQKLQQNGCPNINTSNIKNIKSLQDILSLINSKNTVTPTTKPAATPAPTKTPTPTTKPTATPAPTKTPSGTTNSSYSNQVLQLVNQERAKAGLTPFTTTSALSAAGNKRAQEIKQSFSHTRPDGSSCFTVLGQYGISYTTAGENIAYGQKTPQEVVTGWMNSPGHRANILNPNFHKIGIGVYQSNGVYYWTQEFTN